MAEHVTVRGRELDIIEAECLTDSRGRVCAVQLDLDSRVLRVSTSAPVSQVAAGVVSACQILASARLPRRLAHLR